MSLLFLVAHEDGKFIGFGEAGLDAIVSILGVFLVLLIIIGAVKLLSFIKVKKEEVKEEAAPVPSASPLGQVNVNDEEMMAAVLVASIDFYEETKEAPHVVGVKEL